MAEYDPEFAYDSDEDLAPEEVRWGMGADAFDWGDVDVDEDDEKTIFERLLEFGENKSDFIPLTVKKRIDPSICHSLLVEGVWNSLPDGVKYHGWRKWMAKYTVAQCATVAERFLTVVVHSADGNRAINAYSGYGHYDPARNGVWVPDSDHEFVFVVPVTPAAAATAQMAAACVKMVTKTVYKEYEGKNQAISSYTYDKAGGGRHPEAVKLGLPHFVAFRPDMKRTKANIVKQPFVWEALALKLSALPVLAPEMKPISAYHFLLGQVVNVPNPNLNYESFLKWSGEMSFKNYRHAIRHAWYVGGVKVPQGYFMARDQALNFTRISWSGQFASDLPNWAMFAGAMYEGSGISNGAPELALNVKAINEPSKYSGIVWNPMCPGSAYSRAVGVALPLGDNIVSALKPGLEWLALQTVECCCYGIAAPQPYIVIRQGKSGTNCTLTDLQGLYKSMVGISFFNFVNSLACAANPGRTVYNIFQFHFLDGKLFAQVLDSKTIIPGRYASVSQKTKKETDLEMFFEKYTMGAGVEKRRGYDPTLSDDTMVDADEDPVQPKSKKRKH